MNDIENRNVPHLFHLLTIVALGFGEICLDNRNRFTSDLSTYKATQYLEMNTD